MADDWSTKISLARQRLPLRRMMTERGRPVSTDKKTFKCPYCASDSGSLFHPNGAANEMFKCFSTKCPSQTHGKGAAWDEVKFLAYELGISEREASISYLKESGVWREQDRTAPSVMPGSRARRHKPPEMPKENKVEEKPTESVPPEEKKPSEILSPPDGVQGEPATEEATTTSHETKRDSAENQKAETKPPEEKPATPAPTEGPKEAESEEEDKPVEPFTPQETNDGGILGRAILEEFFLQLMLSIKDEETLFIKRGLTTATSYALGFVSSDRNNENILVDLAQHHSWDELSASGLWLPENKEKRLVRRPNSQFYGLGTKGKKPKDNRRDKRDRWIWGMVHPVLIPYFDEAGKVFKLRPHKGGAPANTLCGANRIYVPRDYRKAADVAESFPKVVICEGEFKAAALWQILGAGRNDGGEPWGVCAIPGINFGNNYDLREELEAWLKAVECRQVIVAFDDQDKSDKPLRERHEAMIWARYLATSLARKLFITGKVCVLPRTWRDASGKADWDGALAKFAHGTI